VICRGGSTRESNIYEDLFYQASTRGGRAVDKIIEGKILFQQRTAGAGKAVGRVADAVELVSLIEDSAAGVQAAGAIGVIGGIVQLIAAKAKPRADTRYWDNLPDHIYAFELPASAANNPYTLKYYDGNGMEIGTLHREIRISAPCHSPLCIIYISSPTYAGKGMDQ